MSLYTGRSKLYSALKDTKLQFEDAKEDWHDSVRQHFEEEFWAPLEAQTQATLRAIDQLNQVLVQLHNDCQ